MIAQRPRPTRTAALLLAVVLLGGGVAARAGDDEAGTLLAAARADLDAGRAADAEAAFRRLVALAPGLLDAHRGLADALAALGRGAEAAAHLAGIAGRLLDAGRAADAVPLAARAAAAAPGDAAVHALHGRALLLEQRHAAAAAALARAVALGDAAPATRLYLAAARWESGDPAAAEALYRELAAGGGPVAVTAGHQLGRLLAWRGDAAAALPWLERTALRRPTAGDVALDVGRALAAAGRPADAAVAFRRALALDPGSHAAWYGLARALVATGDRDAAAAALARHRELYDAERERLQRTGRERAELDRGWELLAAGDPARAVDHFAALAESAEALAGSAAGHAALGRHRRAAELLARAVALAPERRDLALLLDEARRAAEASAEASGESSSAAAEGGRG